MKEITLTKGKVALVDDENFEWLSLFKWSAYKHKHTWYASTGTGKDCIKMHRLLIDCPKGMVRDHIDGNGLNNQRSNLRICTHTQNMQNRRKKDGCSSVYKGVLRTQYGSWIARITIGGRKVHLGSFKTEGEAAIAYNNAASREFGRFALLNIL